MKKLFQMLFHRVVVVALCLIIQVVILVLAILRLNHQFVYFYGICVLISMLAAIYIINGRSNPAYKIAWLIPILLVPFFGGLMYLMFGRNRLSRRQRRKMADVGKNFAGAVQKAPQLLEMMERQDPSAANQSRYIQNSANCPPYQHTTVEYLPLGEVKFERMLEELEKAEHYIFMEYFIIEEGKMWDTILEILARKAAAGVDVRVMYDDMGSILLLPGGFQQKLRKLGIQCCVFNPFVPVLTTLLNNRDHRKICVIDGHTGFTGGINLADEYINAYEKHGHWKDTAVMLKGEAVWSLTAMFLSMWDYVTGQKEDYEQYRPSIHQQGMVEDDGYVQPFSDTPLDDEAVGETVYLNLINKAKRYVYITTPYLIISSEMTTALCTAAKSGVDVRIITPHIGDKWYVHAVTRAHYEFLVEAGVKLYEYTPGFIHAKSFVVDDEYAVVGTINLDYRSLYLHFECGCWMYGCHCIPTIRDDFLATQARSQEISLAQCRSIRWYRKLGRGILKVFAPLM